MAFVWCDNTIVGESPESHIIEHPKEDNPDNWAGITGQHKNIKTLT